MGWVRHSPSHPRHGSGDTGPKPKPSPAGPTERPSGSALTRGLWGGRQCPGMRQTPAGSKKAAESWDDQGRENGGEAWLPQSSWGPSAGQVGCWGERGGVMAKKAHVKKAGDASCTSQRHPASRRLPAATLPLAAPRTGLAHRDMAACNISWSG